MLLQCRLVFGLIIFALVLVLHSDEKCTAATVRKDNFEEPESKQVLRAPQNAPVKANGQNSVLMVQPPASIISRVRRHYRRRCPNRKHCPPPPKPNQKRKKGLRPKLHRPRHPPKRPPPGKQPNQKVQVTHTTIVHNHTPPQTIIVRLDRDEVVPQQNKNTRESRPEKPEDFKHRTDNTSERSSEQPNVTPKTCSGGSDCKPVTKVPQNPDAAPTCSPTKCDPQRPIFHINIAPNIGTFKPSKTESSTEIDEPEKKPPEVRGRIVQSGANFNPILIVNESSYFWPLQNKYMLFATTNQQNNFAKTIDDESVEPAKMTKNKMVDHRPASSTKYKNPTPDMSLDTSTEKVSEAVTSKTERVKSTTAKPQSEPDLVISAETTNQPKDIPERTKNKVVDHRPPTSTKYNNPTPDVSLDISTEKVSEAVTSKTKRVKSTKPQSEPDLVISAETTNQPKDIPERTKNKMVDHRPPTSTKYNNPTPDMSLDTSTETVSAAVTSKTERVKSTTTKPQSEPDLVISEETTNQPKDIPERTTKKEKKNLQMNFGAKDFKIILIKKVPHVQTELVSSTTLKPENLDEPTATEEDYAYYELETMDETDEYNPQSTSVTKPVPDLFVKDLYDSTEALSTTKVKSTTAKPKNLNQRLFLGQVKV